MSSNNHTVSNAEILLLIAQNNDSGWSHLYDKYAPIMYGVILKVTDNDNIANEILIRAFILLKQQNKFSAFTNNLCVSLIKHTYDTAVHILKHRQIAVKDNYTLLQLLTNY